MSEGPGLGAICLVQPCQAAGVVPTVSMPMTDSCEALASALPSKEKRVGVGWGIGPVSSVLCQCSNWHRFSVSSRCPEWYS